MKKIILLIILFFLLSSFYGCSKDVNKKIYGKYEFDKCIFVWVASSSSPEYLNEEYSGTKYIIDKNKFEIISPENKVQIEIKSPIYKKEKMDDDLMDKFNKAVYDCVSISKYKEKYQYSIYDKDNFKFHYYIYSLDDELWIASTHGSDIEEIVKLN